MVAKALDWSDGAVLEEHSKRKHKILREYFFRYIEVRCRNPKQTKFRLAVVDGFAGGGKYACGSPGSPIIMIEELQRALEAVNLRRAAQALSPVEIECFFIFNEALPDVQQLLRRHSDPLVAAIKENCPNLSLEVAYLCEDFQAAYPAIKKMIAQRNYRNVIYNLDQYGHSSVDRSTLIDIMSSSPSAEVFYTFAIQSLLAFLRKSEPELLTAQLRPFGLSSEALLGKGAAISKQAWLGAAERIVFDVFSRCAPYVTKNTFGVCSLTTCKHVRCTSLLLKS